jgi:hypothetical protein
MIPLLGENQTVHNRTSVLFVKKNRWSGGTEWLANHPGKGAGPGKKGGCRHCVDNSESISKISKITRTNSKKHPCQAHGNDVGAIMPDYFGAKEKLQVAFFQQFLVGNDLG